MTEDEELTTNSGHTMAIGLDGHAVSKPMERSHFLVVASGGSAGKFIEVGPELLTVGRSSRADFSVEDPSVSSRHCVVRVSHDCLLVRDLKSTNGTAVDGRPTGSETEAIVPVGGTLQLGRFPLRHELRHQSEMMQAQELSREVRKAAEYVRSLLPDPIEERGLRVTSEFVPTVHLGGDAFGWGWLDEHRLMVYVIDAVGHGVASALHTVAALNAVRTRSLANADFHRPETVLASLTETFPTDNHDGRFLTAWYGVVDVEAGVLRFASAGHPPALLIREGQLAARLSTRGTPIGTYKAGRYRADEARLQAGDRLLVFTDGVYEVSRHDGRAGTLDDLSELAQSLLESGQLSPSQVYVHVKASAAHDELDDDFALIQIEVL